MNSEVVSSDKPRAFPVLNPQKAAGVPSHIRWDALNEEWAQKNHGQSLAELARRGGMDPIEIVCNMQKRSIYRHGMRYDFAASQLPPLAATP